MTRCWLVKTEPTTYSVSHLEKDKRTLWDGVRNYQARNFLVEMKKGDKVLIYHSSTEPIGVAGIATISKLAEPDATQFDRKSDYYDPKATKENPRWFAPEIEFVTKFSRLITMEELRSEKRLMSLMLLNKGNRLSVMPLDEDQFKLIQQRGAEKSKT